MADAGGAAARPLEENVQARSRGRGSWQLCEQAERIRKTPTLKALL